MSLLEMPPYVVIRPSGVWNSRAPFHNFLQEHRWQNRTYSVLTMAACRLIYEARRETNQGRPGRRFMKTARGGAVAGKAWQTFRLSYPVDRAGERPIPTVAEVEEALRLALYGVRESAILNYVSFFETFVRGWALNFLLSRLERGEGWTPKEEEIAREMSPVHSQRHPPSWPFIVCRLPFLEDELSNIPHVSTDPSTGQQATAPVSRGLNALTAIRFWRDFRNLAVHSGGVVSVGFKRKHGALFDLLREPYSDFMGPLEVGLRIQFYDDTFRAVATTHYKVAARMREILEEHSGCRRGHFHAPGLKPDSFHLEGHETPPPLLLDGDHAESLEWVRSFEKAEEVAVAEESAEGEA